MSAEKENDVVIKAVPETQVYFNQAGNICISQPNTDEYGIDMFVYFPVHYAPEIIKALKDKIKEYNNE